MIDEFNPDWELSMIKDINRCLEASWDAYERTNGRRVDLPGATADQAATLRTDYFDVGWEVYAIHELGKFWLQFYEPKRGRGAS